jgi:hypothetical protein
MTKREADDREYCQCMQGCSNGRRFLSNGWRDGLNRTSRVLPARRGRTHVITV